MKTTIKTSIAAVLAGVLLVGCETHIGGSGSRCGASGDKKCEMKTGVGVDQVGRYQISGVGDHWMIIDTATGQVWRTYVSPTDGTPDADFFKPKLPQTK